MIILASASPRRQELLQQIGCTFRCMPSDACEIDRQDISPQDLVIHNARLKAVAVSGCQSDLPVLGADTVVCLDGKIFGKPADSLQARQMLQALSGRWHEVCTGIALVSKGEIWTDAVTTRVRFAELEDAVIERYVASGEPDDKAGAYAIQGAAAAFIEGIEGCYSNVVGLPLARLTKLAKKAGIDLR
ncbi:MAG: Maf family protein [Selenomonadaceae bacterium]